MIPNISCTYGFHYFRVKKYFFYFSSEAKEVSGPEDIAEEEEPDGDSLGSEEYDSEEDDSDRGRSKKRKNDGYGFIIDEAEVDDEVEDEDEWEEGATEIGIVPNEVGLTAREIEGRRRGTNLWEYVDKKHVTLFNSNINFI